MRPLADLRILAVEQFGAGPWGSLQLADLGADVIKIEDPAVGGDVGRYVPPRAEGEDSLFFEVFNRGKRSLSLDLTSRAGRGVFEDLVRGADAVFSNLRGDVPARIGIRYQDLREVNPAIVCCSLSGFGMTGPRAAEPGYDYVLQGLAGWMDLTGEPEGPPTKSGLSMVDYSGGLTAAISLLAGVHAARRDGVGMDCDVSLYDTAISMLTYPAVWALNGEVPATRQHHSAHPSLVPFGAFRTLDSWIVVACAKEKFWARLAARLDHDEWALATHPWGTFSGRADHRDAVLAELDRLFSTRTSGAWIDDLTAAGIPCGPVNTLGQALEEEQTAARAMVVTTDHPRFGWVRQPRTAVSAGPLPTRWRRAPARGEDRDDVLRELLGYDEGQVARLAAEGAFGAPPPATEGGSG